MDLIQKEVKRIVIPDNDYLPFVSIKELLMDMEVGEIIALPIRKNFTVKTMVKRVEESSNREYRCCSNVKEQTIDVCRFL